MRMASKLNKQSAMLTIKKASKPSIKTIICPICEEAIVDPSSKNVGHDSRCAGMSKAAFEKVCDTDDPFFCPYCRLVRQGVEITSLKANCTSLLDELSSVKALVKRMNAKVSLPVPPPVHPLNLSSASEHGVSPIVSDPFPNLSSKPLSKSSHHNMSHCTTQIESTMWSCLVLKSVKREPQDLFIYNLTLKMQYLFSLASLPLFSLNLSRTYSV